MTPPILSTPILSTPIKVGMCFGIPHNNGIIMALIISISTPDDKCDFFVHYAYFNSGKVRITKTTFNTKHYPTGGEVLIKHLWNGTHVVLL